MKNNLIFGAIVIVISVVLSAVFIKPVQNITNQVTDTLGSASSPSVVGGCMDINGVTNCYYKHGLTLSSTTPCAIKSPSATSTLVYRSGIFDVSSSSAAATYGEFGKATTAFATTTSLGIFSYAANIRGAVFATSTTSQAPDDSSVFAPNTYFVIKTAGNTQLDGSCQAQFRVIR